MSTIIRTDLFDKGLEVKESYETIKKRLFTAGEFIEATSSVGKITISKSVIKSASPVPKEKKIKNIQAEGQTKIKEGKTKHGRS